MAVKRPTRRPVGRAGGALQIGNLRVPVSATRKSPVSRILPVRTTTPVARLIPPAKGPAAPVLPTVVPKVVPDFNAWINSDPDVTENNAALDVAEQRAAQQYGYNLIGRNPDGSPIFEEDQNAGQFTVIGQIKEALRRNAGRTSQQAASNGVLRSGGFATEQGANAEDYTRQVYSARTNLGDTLGGINTQRAQLRSAARNRYAEMAGQLGSDGADPTTPVSDPTNVADKAAYKAWNDNAHDVIAGARRISLQGNPRIALQGVERYVSQNVKNLNPVALARLQAEARRLRAIVRAR